MSGTYENAPRCDKMLGNNQTAVLNSNPRKDGKENSKWAPLVWLDDKESYSISKELYPIQKTCTRSEKWRAQIGMKMGSVSKEIMVYLSLNLSLIV